MKRNVLLLSLPLLGALSAGCVVRARAGATYDPGPPPPPPAYVEPPTLVAVDSGVWVVRDSDYPTYYVNDEYWVYRDDVWYRSRYYDRDWVTVQVNVVPAPIVRRDHRVYVHFRGEAGAQTQIAPRAPERIEAHRAPEATPVTRAEAPSTGRGEVLVPARERHENGERINDARNRDNGPATVRRADEARPAEVRHDERPPTPPNPPLRRPEDVRPTEVKRDERRAAPPSPARRIDEERAADAVRRQKSDEKKREDNKPQDNKKEDERRK
jgi:hypothetical protein